MISFVIVSCRKIASKKYNILIKTTAIWLPRKQSASCFPRKKNAVCCQCNYLLFFKCKFVVVKSSRSPHATLPNQLKLNKYHPQQTNLTTPLKILNKKKTKTSQDRTSPWRHIFLYTRKEKLGGGGEPSLPGMQPVLTLSSRKSLTKIGHDKIKGA
jgi:hypothetical protein